MIYTINIYNKLNHLQGLNPIPRSCQLEVEKGCAPVSFLSLTHPRLKMGFGEIGKQKKFETNSKLRFEYWNTSATNGDE